ncbi:hypothetical protein JQ609_20020 [Bradyrhizobium sp. AUGA SZCCT0169]|uniref:hypothetical protein n=1 Tax=Bradyrhizobium sp. AUGA SZCCT0169 TaxID=2807663 RepID=UPI001BA84031|nr:hypothetical protein [Bradyrhizobium sp. AUGA SZCCT0169]MBR1249202.1 hypothetical protein [Bradyrhizobium sp. AUGA SZCCT0169]
MRRPIGAGAALDAPQDHWAIPHRAYSLDSLFPLWLCYCTTKPLGAGNEENGPMMTSLLIVGTVAAVAAGWGANGLWVQWERDYREKHGGPPPGGDATGYAVVIGAFFAAATLSTKVLLWMG